MDVPAELEVEARIRTKLCKPHLQRLRRISESEDVEDDASQRECIMETCSFLHHCGKLVEKYKEYKIDRIDDEYIREIDSALKALKFDSNMNGLSEEAHLYKSLHWESKQGLKELVDAMEQQIQVPMEKFLQKLEFTEDPLWSNILCIFSQCNFDPLFGYDV
nr:unnamed protein product [Callosobruchus chinensis]